MPIEHLDEQIEGVGTLLTRASSARGGIAGGRTTGGDKGCDTLAQAASSARGISSISARLFCLVFGILDYLSRCFSSSGFLGPRSGFGC